MQFRRQIEWKEEGMRSAGSCTRLATGCENPWFDRDKTLLVYPLQNNSRRGKEGSHTETPFGVTRLTYPSRKTASPGPEKRGNRSIWKPMPSFPAHPSHTKFRCVTDESPPESFFRVLRHGVCARARLSTQGEQRAGDDVVETAIMKSD